MAVRIRMKRLGRRHRPFYRICAMDSRSPRDGKVIEELGYYDPMVRETDARAILQSERIDYWISQGALPTEKVKVLIDKYGTNGSCLEKQREALGRLATQKPVAPAPQKVPLPEEATTAEPQESAQTDDAQPEPAADTAEATGDGAGAGGADAESGAVGDTGETETATASEQTESEEKTESK